jgi:hypothetical protein
MEQGKKKKDYNFTEKAASSQYLAQAKERPKTLLLYVLEGGYKEKNMGQNLKNY